MMMTSEARERKTSLKTLVEDVRRAVTDENDGVNDHCSVLETDGKMA